jgi:hypothetical protein
MLPNLDVEIGKYADDQLFTSKKKYETSEGKKKKREYSIKA